MKKFSQFLNESNNKTTERSEHHSAFESAGLKHYGSNYSEYKSKDKSSGTHLKYHTHVYHNENFKPHMDPVHGPYGRVKWPERDQTMKTIKKHLVSKGYDHFVAKHGKYATHVFTKGRDTDHWASHHQERIEIQPKGNRVTLTHTHHLQDSKRTIYK